MLHQAPTYMTVALMACARAQTKVMQLSQQKSSDCNQCHHDVCSEASLPHNTITELSTRLTAMNECMRTCDEAAQSSRVMFNELERCVKGRPRQSNVTWRERDEKVQVVLCFWHAVWGL
jgi:hypothetical protein